jgi:HD-GYP domain-containing protein (c-di-GMP phosphodiesterase class II)
VVHTEGASTAPLAFPEPPEAARALIEALALVHPEAAEHARAVARLGWQISSALRLAPAERARIAVAGLLHDIGLIAAPETASANGDAAEASSLSRHNGDEPPQHARVGEELLRGIPTLGSVAELVGAHHEWWDGTGYPRGLRGEEIPLGGGVVAVADAYDTLARASSGHRKAATLVATLRQAAGTRLDPGVVTEALRVLPR